MAHSAFPQAARHFAYMLSKWSWLILALLLLGLASMLPLLSSDVVGRTETDYQSTYSVESNLPMAGAVTVLADPAAAPGARILGITAGVGMRRDELEGAVPIAVTFSEPVDRTSAQAAFSLRPSAQGAFRWQGNTFIFTPKQPLTVQTAYTATVNTTAKTLRGKRIQAALSVSFKTAAPPSVLRTLPTMGASEVPTDAVVTVTFDRPMTPLTSLSTQPDAKRWLAISPPVRGRWVWLGTAAVGFQLEGGLTPATLYTVEVRAGWPDAAGVPLAEGALFNFTTIKPGIVSINPGSYSEHVDLDAPVVVEFNQPMDPAATQRAFSLRPKDGKEALPGSYLWSVDRTTMTFTSASLLLFNRDYRAEFNGSVKSVVGSPADLAGTNNFREFRTTSTTIVRDYSPKETGRPVSAVRSFSISFNNPLAPQQDVAQYLTVDPLPEGYRRQLKARDEGTSVYTDSVSLLPSTTYTFTLREGLRDKWGYPVAPTQWQVKVGPKPASIEIGESSFIPLPADGPSRVPIRVTNLQTVTLSLSSLNELETVYNIEGLRSLGTSLRSWQLAATPGEDGVSLLYPALGVREGEDRLPPGYYFLRAEAPSGYGYASVEGGAVLVVGRTGLVVKREAGEKSDNLLVWAADLRTGRPVPDYPVRAERWRFAGDSPHGTQRGRTGPDGVLRLSLDPSENMGEIIVWGEAEAGAAIASTRWSNNIAPCSSDIPCSYEEMDERHAVYTDRPIYRPGHTVYFRGVWRLEDDALYTLPPAGATVDVTASTYDVAYGDVGRETVYTATLSLSPAGTYNGQFTLPEGAPTGDYSLSVGRSGEGKWGDMDAHATFSVAEYRKPDFRVDVATRGSVVKGDPLTATLATGYYFGGSLANLTATVNLWVEPYSFGWQDPSTGESYSFGDNTSEERGYSGYSPDQDYNNPTINFRARTDEQGLLVADLSTYITDTERSLRVDMEGQVQDVSNQAVAGRGNLVVHAGQYYIGLRRESYVAQAGQPLTVTVRTVAPDEQAKSGGRVVPSALIALRLLRQEWIEGPGKGDERWQLNETPAGEAAVTTDAKGRAAFQLTPPLPGTYRLVAEGRDSRGNRVTSSVFVWVAGDAGRGYSYGYVPWRYPNRQGVRLIADKEQYRVGETARILVTSPYTEATALLTVERGHLRRYKVLTLQGSAPTVEVPLEAGDLPNVYIGLTLLGRGGAPAGAPPDWVESVGLRQGYVGLALDTGEKKLGISIEPQGKGPFLPGETAPVRLSIRDSEGKPVQSELSLAVVDEAIFALADDTSTNLSSDFWGERGLRVRTSTSFSSGENHPVSRPSDTLPATGGGGPSEPRRVRSDFRDTAFWRATVTTGADGSALVPVPLPDNLTTWRLTAQAVTADSRFGRAAVPLTVTQPLLLRPVLPRFLISGDAPRPQAVIHNNTAAILHVEASLTVSGALTLDGKSGVAQRLTLAPGGQGIVTWSAKVGNGSQARLQYWVRTVSKAGAGYLKDAVAIDLPVKPLAALEVVAVSGEVAGTRTDESLFLPYSIDPLLGELVVQVSPSLAAATTDAAAYVKDFAYHCSEQTTSRFLPLVTLDGVYREQGRTTPYTKEMPLVVEQAFKRLAELQQYDGGWGWWEQGPSQWWHTAYVVHGLIAARDAGYAVPAGMLQRGIERLRGFGEANTPPGIDETYSLNMRAYTLYVLSRAVEKGDSLMEEGRKLAGQTPRMSVHARAWLAMALGELGLAAESKATLDSLVAAARQNSTTAYWEESAPDYRSMGTNTRATAIALQALVTLRPGDPLVAKGVRWLVTDMRGGRWRSTQETTFSLLALADYIRAGKELQADYPWSVSAYGKSVGSGVANASNLTQTQTMRVPVAGLPQNSAGNLTLSRGAQRGKMYYRASLRYYVQGEQIPARSEGMAVTRTYYRTNGGSPVSEARAGDLLTVRLTIVIPQSVQYVLVKDPLPAGLEAVNGSLNTSSYTERPPNPRGGELGEDTSGDGRYYYWGPFSNVEMRDDHTALFADYMGPGTYVYEYYARATTPGVYNALPAHAEQMYFPDVFGHSDGGRFTVK